MKTEDLKQKLTDIRGHLYAVNSLNVSLRMIELNKRDDKTVYNTNECLGEILKDLDEVLKEL